MNTLFPTPRQPTETFLESAIRRRMETRGLTHGEALDSLINDMLWSKRGNAGVKGRAEIRDQCRIILEHAAGLHMIDREPIAAAAKRIMELV